MCASGRTARAVLPAHCSLRQLWNSGATPGKHKRQLRVAEHLHVLPAPQNSSRFRAASVVPLSCYCYYQLLLQMITLLYVNKRYLVFDPLIGHVQ